MRYALTALVLTFAYIVVLIASPPAAVGIGGIYLSAVAILIAAQRLTDRRHRERP